MFFMFTASNVPCGSTGVTCTKAVDITINDQTVHLVRGRDMQVGTASIASNQYYTHGLMVQTIGANFITVVAPELGIVVKYDEGESWF